MKKVIFTLVTIFAITAANAQTNTVAKETTPATETTQTDCKEASDATAADKKEEAATKWSPEMVANYNKYFIITSEMYMSLAKEGVKKA